jgi:hypothetical protein
MMNDAFQYPVFNSVINCVQLFKLLHYLVSIWHCHVYVINFYLLKTGANLQRLEKLGQIIAKFSISNMNSGPHRTLNRSLIRHLQI